MPEKQSGPMQAEAFSAVRQTVCDRLVKPGRTLGQRDASDCFFCQPDIFFNRSHLKKYSFKIVSISSFNSNAASLGFEKSAKDSGTLFAKSFMLSKYDFI